MRLELTDGAKVRSCSVAYDLWDVIYRVRANLATSAVTQIDGVLLTCWGGPAGPQPVSVQEVP